MKIIFYYLVLLVFIALLTGFLFQANADEMSMGTMISISVLLGVYAIMISVVGEGKTADEREMYHRYVSNRMALIAGTVVLSLGVLVGIFTHELNYWLLGGLIVINLVKIISMIYLNYKK